MAARVQPQNVRAAHQSMHHLVAHAPWDDSALLRAVADRVLPEIVATGEPLHLMVDDPGFPGKGTHSVGVARRFCGQTGKSDSCRVAVSLSIGNPEASPRIAGSAIWRTTPAGNR